MANDTIAPYPGEFKLNGRIFMVVEATDAKGVGLGVPLWEQDEQPYTQGQPTPLSDPYTTSKTLAIAQGFNNFRQGAGARDQGVQVDRDVFGYWKGRYIDKYGRALGNAAAVYTALVPAASAYDHPTFFEYNSALYLAANGQLSVRNDDTYGGWSLSQALNTHASPGGGGPVQTLVPGGVAVFRGTQSSDFYFIAAANAIVSIYSANGSEDTNKNAALDFAVFRNKLFRLYQDTDKNYKVASCTDGGQAATWGAGFSVADSTNPCLNFVVKDDHLLVRSQKGLLTTTNVSALVADNVTGSTFSSNLQTLNRCRPIAFTGNNSIICQNANSWYAYDPVSGQVEEIGPATMKDNDDQTVNGYVTSAVPYRSWSVYYSVYNPSTDTSYIYRWGEWEHISTMFNPVDEVRFLPTHIGALWEEAGQIDALYITEVTGSPRLYWTNTTATPKLISYMPLPLFSSNATADSTMTYNATQPFELFLPGIHAHIPHENKAFVAVEVNTKNAVAGSVQVTASYRLDQTSAFGGSNNLENQGVFDTDPGRLNKFQTSVVSRWMDLKLSGIGTSTTPMLVSGATVYTSARPPFRWLATTTLRIGDEVMFKDGNTAVYSVPDQFSFLATQAEAGVIPMVAPDGSSFDGMVTHVGKARASQNQDTKHIEYLVDIEVLQLSANYGAGAHKNLAPWTHAQLANWTHGELANFA